MSGGWQARAALLLPRLLLAHRRRVPSSNGVRGAACAFAMPRPHAGWLTRECACAPLPAHAHASVLPMQAHPELSNGSVVYLNIATGERRDRAPPGYSLSLDEGSFILRVFSFATLGETGFTDLEAEFVNTHRPGALTKTTCRRIGMEPPLLQDVVLMMSDVHQMRRKDKGMRMRSLVAEAPHYATPFVIDHRHVCVSGESSASSLPTREYAYDQVGLFFDPAPARSRDECVAPLPPLPPQCMALLSCPCLSHGSHACIGSPPPLSPLPYCMLMLYFGDPTAPWARAASTSMAMMELR